MSIASLGRTREREGGNAESRAFLLDDGGEEEEAH